MALQEAEMDITTLAHSTRRTQGDEYLAVRFYHKPMQQQDKSLKAGRPIFEDVAYIEIMQPGNKDNIIQRPATEMDKQRFAKHYAMWKARTSNEDVQLVGTPLSEWAGVTRSQANELSFFNVKTVEQLANMADSNTNNMMGLGNLKEKARKYLDSSADQATIDALAALKAENAEMREMVKSMMAGKTAESSPVVLSQEIEIVQPKEDYGVEHDPLDDIVPRGTTIAPQKRKRRSKAEIAAAKAE